jgi:signal transduction histidine kinase
VRRVLEIGLRQGHGGGVSQVLSMRDVTHETEVDLMKSEFLSTAAHELRTPMSSIYGFSELMLRRRLSPERQQEVVATIHRQSELMIAIINELLDLARIEARRGQDFVLESCDLTQLLPALVADFRAPGQRPEPQLDLGTRPAPVNVDPAKLRQALLNVLSNAYKYSPGGGAVDVRLLRDDGLLRLGIEVRDHGIGMTPEQLARVSERFYRADASGTIPGTGLGMSIVKEIVELLGGSLALASEAGQGTTVTLWLPCAGVDAGTRAQALEEA